MSVGEKCQASSVNGSKKFPALVVSRRKENRWVAGEKNCPATIIRRGKNVGQLEERCLRVGEWFSEG